MSRKRVAFLFIAYFVVASDRTAFHRVDLNERKAPGRFDLTGAFARRVITHVRVMSALPPKADIRAGSGYCAPTPATWRYSPQSASPNAGCTQGATSICI